jgi:hypothetical protein
MRATLIGAWRMHSIRVNTSEGTVVIDGLRCVVCVGVHPDRRMAIFRHGKVRLTRSASCFSVMF